MNLRDKTPKNTNQKFWLALLIAPAFFIASCDDPKDIGIDLQDSDYLLNTQYVDTITVNTSTVLLPDIQTSEVSVLLIGAYNDNPDFGLIKSTAFTQVLLGEEFKDFGSNPVCDSMKLFLDYNGHYYGDTSTAQTLEVYEVLDLMDQDSAYTIQSSHAVSALPIGTSDAGFTATPLDADTTICIKLDSTFGDKIIANGNNDNATFVSLVRGISIQPLNGQYTGSVFGINMTSSSTRAEIYYHNDTDTLMFTVSLWDNGNQARFSKVEADRSATFLNTLASKGDSVSTNISLNEGFMQAGTGLAAKITFPHLQDFIDSAGNVTINRADLVMFSVDGSTSGDHDAPSLFYTLFQSNTSNTIAKDGDLDIIIPNDFVNTGISPDEEYLYDDGEDAIRMRITSYIDALVHGRVENTGLLLRPTFSSVLISRMKYYDNTNVSSPGKTMKLVLYYSTQDGK